MFGIKKQIFLNLLNFEFENNKVREMGAHSSKDKLARSYSDRYIHTQVIERERFGSFGKRAKGKCCIIRNIFF